MTDEEIVTALAAALFACVEPEIDGTEQDWDEARGIAATLLPLVRRVAEQRAAEAIQPVLDLADSLVADAGVFQYAAPGSHDAGVRLAYEATAARIRAAALTATSDHGTDAT